MKITHGISYITVMLLTASSTFSQRVAPGVPPQHYQQGNMQQPPQLQHPQHPPQYQQVPQQMPQGQVQYNQPPPVHQQQYQQQPNMQAPNAQVPVQQQMHQQAPQHHPGGGHGGHQQQVLNAGNMDHERAHIQEHMDVPMDTSKMSEAELQFHYFKMHDSDNNNKLDGCELIKSLIHWHEQGSKEPHTDAKPHIEEKIFSDEELIGLIDPILSMDDTSRDGYIDYPEFIRAQEKAAAQQGKKPRN